MRTITLLVILIATAVVIAGCLEDSPFDPEDENAASDDEKNSRFQPYVPPVPETNATQSNGSLPDDAAALDATFSPLRTGYFGAEPSIGVTHGGNVFITASADAVRSTDDGESWDVVSTAVSAPTTFDPYLWVDQATDRVYHVNLYVANSYMSISDDEGESWITHPAAGGPGDHQKMTTGPPAPNNPLAGVAHPSVVYYAVNLLLYTQISMSYDGGLTWPSQPTEIPFECAGGINGQPHGAPSGTAYVPYYDCGGLVVARSDDNGLSWETILVDDSAGRGIFDPDMASDTAGNTYAVGMGGSESDYTTVFSVSGDDGLSWSTMKRVAPEPLGTTIFPTVVAGDEGNLWIAYYATKDTTDHPDDAEEDTEWYLYATHITGAHTNEPNMTSHLLDPHPVQLGRICTGGIGCDSNRNLLEFIDTAIDPDTGRLWLVYTDGCDEDCTEEEDSQSRISAVARLDEGPSLFDDVGRLGPFGVGE